MGTSSKDAGFSLRRVEFEWLVGCPDGLVWEVRRCGILGGQASDGAAGVGLRPVTHLCIGGWGGGDGSHSREE